MSQAAPHVVSECRCVLCHSWRRVGGFIADPRLGVATREFATQRLRDLCLDLLDKREEEVGGTPVAVGGPPDKTEEDKCKLPDRAPEDQGEGKLAVKEELREDTPPVNRGEAPPAESVTRAEKTPEKSGSDKPVEGKENKKKKEKKERKKLKKQKKEKGKEKKKKESDTSPAVEREKLREKAAAPEPIPEKREGSDSLDPSSESEDPVPEPPGEREEAEKSDPGKRDHSDKRKEERDSRSRGRKKRHQDSRTSRSGRREHRSRPRERPERERTRLTERPAEPYYPPASSGGHLGPTHWTTRLPGNWKSTSAAKGIRKRERAQGIRYYGTDSDRKAARESWYRQNR